MYDYDDYTAADAAADEASENWEEAVSVYLEPLVEAAIVEKYGEDWEENEAHEDVDFDAVREELREDSELREEAEEAARDAADANTPCCNSFSCPCGN